MGIYNVRRKGTNERNTLPPQPAKIEHGKEEEGEKILIAMGDYGKVSRVAGFVFGSVITYSFVGSAVAPGQIELKEMVRLRSLLFS